MKTKNKLLALVEIAIVLCSVFLVATLPGLAADQNQTMQKVSTSTITTASEDDCIDIYGNANEDNALDMRDVTYIKLIIFEEKPETTLADANYDGDIDLVDLVQTKLIILGRAGRLTIIDSDDRAVTLDLPIERVVDLSTGGPTKTFRVLGAVDKIVGINGMITGSPFLSEVGDLPSVGWPDPDYEAIVDLDPDLVVASPNPYLSFDIVERMEPYGIKVALLDCSGEPVQYNRELRILGVILVNQERANEYIDFLESNFNRAQEKLEELSPEEKKTIYFEFMYPYEILSRSHETIELGGGIDIFADLWTGITWYHTITVEPEEVSYENPDVILKDPHDVTWSGYADGVIDRMEDLRGEVMTRSGWGGMSAVESGEVYIISREFGNERMISTCFLAKLLYPDLFSDMDTGAIMREYLEEYHGMDYDEYQAVIYHPTKLMK
jgi:iron complex transport system substrate-binding protein